MRYDDHLALDLGEHAAAVYKEPHEYERWVWRRGFAGSTIIPRGSTQVGIAYSPERIIVAARGSSQWGDWGENALCFPWGWKPVFPVGRTHFGFQMQARRIRKEFIETMADLRERYPAAKVYVTGHSLGGALATFITHFLALAGARAEATYTFESPRVFKAEASLWFNAEYGDHTFRVVIAREGSADIVSRLPPSAWGWTHVGQPVIIRDGIRYETEMAWQAMRSKHPVKPLAHWRLLTRLVTAARAHLSEDMVRDLRAQAARA